MTGYDKPAANHGLRPWFRRHRIATLILVNLVVLTGGLVLVEVAYRGQWIDFHRSDLAAFNRPEELAPSTRPTILALGDSFTAGRDNWPGHLQDLLAPNIRVVNSGVGGSTIRQMRIIIDGRLERFSPRRVICQIYTGNDLLDLRHPARSGTIGPFRRLYWRTTDGGLMSPWYFNTKLRLATDRLSPVNRLEPAETERIIRKMEARPFAADRYSPRSRMLREAYPSLLTDQIAVSGEMAAAWPVYRNELERLMESCRAHGARLTLMVVPHCAQVSREYAERFMVLGADISDPGILAIDEYPFVVKLRTTAAAYPGVEVLNLLQTLRSTEATGRKVYFPNDPHLNRAGRLEVAGIAANELESR